MGAYPYTVEISNNGGGNWIAIGRIIDERKACLLADAAAGDGEQQARVRIGRKVVHTRKSPVGK